MLAVTHMVDDDPAVLLATGGTVENPTRTWVLNAGSLDLLVGGAGVTSLEGFTVAAGVLIGPFDLVGGDDLYGICMAGETTEVRVLSSES